MYEDIKPEWKNPQKSQKSSTKTIVILTICMLLGVIASGVLGYFIAFGANKLVSKEEYDFVKSYDMETIGKFDLLIRSLSYAQQNYYGDMDLEELDKVAALAVMNGIDDFTSMVNTSSLIANNVTSTGLGVITNTNVFNETTIVRVLDDSGSHGKLQRGDILYAIDDKRVINAPSSYISLYLRGAVGATFKITVKRGEEMLSFDIEKKEYTNSQAYYLGELGEGISDDLGYIELSSFTLGAANDFANCIQQLKTDGKKGLILDLRNNGGGSGDILGEIASYLVKDSSKPFATQLPIIEFEREKAGKTSVTYTKDATNYINMPIYILANGGSASASEGLIGAMLYYGTGELIGSKTYGKGVGQVGKMITDNDGSSYRINLVEGYYYVYTKDTVTYPTGKMTIHGVGFTPKTENIVLSQDKITVNMNDDSFIKRANDLFSKRG